MDLEINFSLSFFFLALIPMAVAAFLTHFKGYKSRSKKKLPPGEMGLPWIGETIDFYKAQKNNKLFEEFVQPRIDKYGKTFKTRIMGSPTVLVNGAEANKFFLSNEFKFVVSSWPSSSVQLMGKNSIMEKQGEAHRFIRGIVASSLGCLGLETMVPKICKTVQMHLDNNWQGKQIISLFHLTKMLTFNIVFECLLGIDVKPRLLDTFERVLEGVFAPPLAFPGSKFWQVARESMRLFPPIFGSFRKAT